MDRLFLLKLVDIDNITLTTFSYTENTYKMRDKEHQNIIL